MLHAYRNLDRNFRLLSLSFLLWGFGQSMFVYIQPLYIASLGATPEQIGLVLSASSVVVTLLYIPLGGWADRRGRKPVMVAGWTLGTTAALALGLAPDWRWLIPALSAYMLSNFAMPATNGYVAAISSERQIGRVFAFLSGSSAVGSVLSPALGGWVADTFGFRVVYICAAVSLALSTLMIALVAPQPVVSRAAAQRPAHLLRRVGFLPQIGLTLLVFFAIDLGQVMTPKFLQDVHGLSLTQIGWLGTVGTLGIVTMMFLFSRLPVYRPWPLLACQLTACVAVSIWLSSAALPLLALAYFIHGSDRVVRPTMQGRISRLLDPASMSAGYGYYETALRLGLAISPWVAGQLYARAHAWPFYASLAGLLLSGALTLALPLRRAAAA